MFYFALWIWENPNISFEGVAAGIAAVAAVISPFASAAMTTKRMEGSFGARLDNLDNAVEELKDEQIRQWQEIGNVGKQVERIEGSMERRGRSRGANA